MNRDFSLGVEKTLSQNHFEFLVDIFMIGLMDLSQLVRSGFSCQAVAEFIQITLVCSTRTRRVLGNITTQSLFMCKSHGGIYWEGIWKGKRFISLPPSNKSIVRKYHFFAALGIECQPR